MNFFEHEERAQRKTVRLIVYYCLALLLTFWPFTWSSRLWSTRQSPPRPNRSNTDYRKEMIQPGFSSPPDQSLIIGIDILIVGLLIGGERFTKSVK